ncbi:MAG: glycosyltransferase [Burkholderiales bacterium]
MNTILKLSLVVLSYKRFDTTTGPCLATLTAALGDPRIELILVDNGSTDGTAAQCAAWAAQHPTAHYLPMPTNLGFGGGMNVGVGIATGEWVCLVNSDTLFPPGAIDALLAALARVPGKVAMLGPVTNAAGNGQCLPLPGLPLLRVAEVGAMAMSHPTGLFTPTYRTDFFCVAIQRSVWHQLGGLDTSFGLGYFEDFDFSLRLRAIGRTQVIAEDVFIAHVGSASFSDMGSAQKQLMRRNRDLLRERHSQAKFEHVRRGNERALRHLVAAALASGWTPALRERAAWRFAALLHDEAKSPFKRWRWRWRTRDLRRTLRADGIAPHFPTPPASPPAP